MSWDKGGGYLHRNAQQANAMSWVGQRRRPAGHMYLPEVAKALGLSERQVKRLVQGGQLKNFASEGGGVLRTYREKDVVDLAARRMIARGLKASG